MRQTFSIMELITWVFKQYQELQIQLQERNLYRVVEIIQEPDEETSVHVQVVGKSVVAKYKPFEIARDDKFLEGFSKKDIRLITYLATEQSYKPKCRILTQDFRKSTKNMVFKLLFIGKKDLIEKSASEISIDKELLKEFSQTDAHLIGYTCASEHAAYAQEEMTRLKKKEKK